MTFPWSHGRLGLTRVVGPAWTSPTHACRPPPNRRRDALAASVEAPAPAGPPSGVRGGEHARARVAVEVKTTLKVSDVDHFLDTLRHLTRLQPDYANRAIYGAVAYLKADEAANTYGERQGLFVIRATGSSASITNRADFRPRTFGRSATHAV